MLAIKMKNGRTLPNEPAETRPPRHSRSDLGSFGPTCLRTTGIPSGTTRTQDLPLSQAGQRRKKVVGLTRSEREARPPNVRRQFAKVFLKPSLNADAETVSFMWVDAKGGTVAHRFVTLRQGLTTTKAKARALGHWDQVEVRRNGNWNLKKAVFWARNRLLRKLAVDAGHYEEATHLPSEEIMDELQEIKTCTEVLESLAAIINEMRGDVDRTPLAKWDF
ncbi:hypothetical protein B0H67DRAFT_658683 [Lasiosphaeris hirsuta]|uniref:Uncharacterized protein n=1 Tax=Lasiosphaeris hirsuta TaxID=260670 RepID=A0AA40E7H6_9PEZI|nr:hypothetical protein B0H67DRAFT_658683 [Lasiosphaeris hirsuta]